MALFLIYPSTHINKATTLTICYDAPLMSKAFTKEDDEREENLDLPEQKLPPGTKNYISPSGEKRLRGELSELLYKTRPETADKVQWAASLGDRSENADYIYNKQRLRQIDSRIRYLTKRLENVEIVHPNDSKTDEIRFGATVSVKNEKDEIKTYTIVGVDEIDLKKRRISWVSPLGSVLLRKKKGDVILFKSPKGEEDLEVLDVQYLEIN